MSWKNNASGAAPKLELKLKLSPPRHPAAESSSPRRRSVSASPPSSCMSSESQDDGGSCRSPAEEEATSMVLVGCPRCLMYVMLAEAKPNKCPMCHTSVLLDVIYDDHTKNART